MRTHLRVVSDEADAAAIHSGRIRVLIAEHHSSLRRSLKALLALEPDIEVRGEAGDPGGVAQLLELPHSQVLILDLRIPGCGGVAYVRSLHDTHPALGIVVTTMVDSPALAVRALQAGATAIVLTDAADRDLAEAVRHASQGEYYVSPRLRPRQSKVR